MQQATRSGDRPEMRFSTRKFGADDTIFQKWACDKTASSLGIMQSLALIFTSGPDARFRAAFGKMRRRGVGIFDIRTMVKNRIRKFFLWSNILHHSFSTLLVMATLSFTAAANAEAPTSAPATHPATQPAGQTTAITRGSLSMVIDAQGAFDPVDPFEVRLKLKAYQGELTITSIAANGAAVKKGDLLLQIDPTVMIRTLTAAENDDRASKASLEKIESDDKVAEESDALGEKEQKEGLQEAEDSVKWFDTVDGPQLLKQVKLGVDQAKAQMDDESDEVDQLKKMYKSEELTNATADIVVKRAFRQLEMSKTLYAMAKDRAQRLVTFTYPLMKARVYEGRDAAQQQYALFETAQKQAKVLRQTGLAGAHAAAEAADLKLEDLKTDAEKLTVHAPTDGVVAYGQIVNGVWSAADPRSLRPGERVMAQTVLMTLYRPGRLRIALDLPEAKFFAIQPGQKASIDPVAFPELKYEAMCDAAPHTAAGGNFLLTLSTGDVDPRIAPGMKAQVHMDVPLVDNVLLAPVSAEKDETVWVKTAKGFEPRHVMTGRSNDKSIEILSGLHEGDEVLTQAK